MKYIPSWVPGAGFKKRAAEYAAVAHEALETPHSYAVSQLVSLLSFAFTLTRADSDSEAAGTALPSLSSRLLGMPDLTEELEDCIRWTTLTLYRGMHNFIDPSLIRVVVTVTHQTGRGCRCGTEPIFYYKYPLTFYPDILPLLCLLPRYDALSERHEKSTAGAGLGCWYWSIANIRRPAVSTLSGSCVYRAFALACSRPNKYVWPPHSKALTTNGSFVGIRRTADDDVYNGYLIPANSYVMVNIWYVNSTQVVGYAKGANNFLISGPCSAMRERTRILWSSNLNVSWEMIRNLIPLLYASVLDDGKEQFCLRGDGTNPNPNPDDAQVSHSRSAELGIIR